MEYENRNAASKWPAKKAVETPTKPQALPVPTVVAALLTLKIDGFLNSKGKEVA